MSATIQTQGLGLSVFGQAQVAYKVNDKTGCSYDEAVAAAGFARSVALECAIPAYTGALRMRQTKLRELGAALAEVAQVGASFDPKDELDDTKSLSSTTVATLNRYGIGGLSGSSVSKANVQKVQADTQYAIDVENNNVQQDLTSLQGLMSKRDNSYGLVSKIVKKAISTESSGIGYIA